MDEWLALAAAVLILFLRAAFEDLLWSFEMAFFGSMVAGLGMLLALERGDRAGDRLACGLLTVSMAFSSLGLSFAAGAAVEIALRPDRWRRRYLVVLPALLFAIWYLGWGHTADNAASLHNFGLMPLFVSNAIAAGLSSMLGLATPTPETFASPSGWIIAALDWGRPLLVRRRIGRVEDLQARQGPRMAPDRRGNWFLLLDPGGAQRKAGPGSDSGPLPIRQCNLHPAHCRGTAARCTARAPQHYDSLIAVGAIVASNVTYLHEGYKIFRPIGEVERADLGALEIVRGTVKPQFLVSEEIGDLPFALTNAGAYFAAVDDFGSPAFSLGEIARAPSRHASPRTRC